MVRILKRRYIAFQMNSPQFYSRRELLKIIFSNVEGVQSGENLEQRFRLIFYDSNTGFGVVRCDHKTALALRCSMELDAEKSFKTIKTSGSIKALKQRLMPKQTNTYTKP